MRRAASWRWSSLWRRERGDAFSRALLADWPVERPQDWRRRISRAETSAELEGLRTAVRRGRPFGDEDWVERMVHSFDLGSTLRPPGRPKDKNDS